MFFENNICHIQRGKFMSNYSPFIGRQYELELLSDLLQTKIASLAVLNGRRRVGKSRLIEKFAEGKTFYQFSGLAPIDGISAQDQRDAFAYQLKQQTGLPDLKSDDWSTLFQLLGERIQKGRVIVLFDEITWMAHGDKTFLAKLKNTWDMHYKKNPKLIFVICGSISAWIEKNIISSTGYFGRVSLHLTLRELPLKACIQLLDKLGFKYSLKEKLIILSLTGGIPWYIEQINPKKSAVDNIKRLCFDKNGLLVNEYEHIFHDLFGRKNTIYMEITKLLSTGAKNYESISDKLSYTKGSNLTDYLNELILSGYISKHPTWSTKTGQLSRYSQYRLCDNYIRFYYKYIAPKLFLIKKGKFTHSDLSSLPGWWGLLGLQFENLVLNNRELILEKLSIKQNQIVAEDPYFQQSTKRIKGCQIDYFIQTKLNTLFVCEIKFSNNIITSKIINEMKQKISRLYVPKGFSVLPVLIHASDITDEVRDAEYFYEIINFYDFLE